jgi:hypothetical protein
MTRRLALTMAAVLAIGACSDQHDPNTGTAEFASVTGSIGINVILKAPATAANRAELAKYGTLLDEIPELNAIRLRAKAEKLASIQALRFVKAATPDAERTAIPIVDVEVLDFADGMSSWDQDAINVTNFGAGRTAAYDGSGVTWPSSILGSSQLGGSISHNSASPRNMPLSSRVAVETMEPWLRSPIDGKRT